MARHRLFGPELRPGQTALSRPIPFLILIASILRRIAGACFRFLCHLATCTEAGRSNPDRLAADRCMYPYQIHTIQAIGPNCLIVLRACVVARRRGTVIAAVARFSQPLRAAPRAPPLTPRSRSPRIRPPTPTPTPTPGCDEVPYFTLLPDRTFSGADIVCRPLNSLSLEHVGLACSLEPSCRSFSTFTHADTRLPMYCLMSVGLMELGANRATWTRPPSTWAPGVLCQGTYLSTMALRSPIPGHTLAPPKAAPLAPDRPPLPLAPPAEEEVAVLVSAGEARTGLMLDAPYEGGGEGQHEQEQEQQRDDAPDEQQLSTGGHLDECTARPRAATFSSLSRQGAPLVPVASRYKDRRPELHPTIATVGCH